MAQGLIQKMLHAPALGYVQDASPSPLAIVDTVAEASCKADSVARCLFSAPTMASVSTRNVASHAPSPSRGEQQRGLAIEPALQVVSADLRLSCGPPRVPSLAQALLCLLRTVSDVFIFLVNDFPHVMESTIHFYLSDCPSACIRIE